MEHKKILDRLNRAQGQIEAIKKELHSGKGDCLSILRLHKAAHSALKKSAEAYVKEYALLCMQKGEHPDVMKETLEEVITSAFSM